MATFQPSAFRFARSPVRLPSPRMPRCRVDTSIERTVVDGFSFPLGVYPVEPMQPKAGYIVEFEPADGGEEGGEGGGTAEESQSAGGGWEEWPDRYVFDVVISSERLEALVRALLALLPGRVYPILDYLGLDAYREVDPYISYDLVGMERFVDALRRYRGFFFEDGLCGFGAMIDEPFLYMFVDEHKILTVRAEPALKEKIEKLLQAFDLEVVEAPAGADAAAHEHRGVLVTPDDRPDLLTADEIVEQLKDEWRLVLNVDPELNQDDEGKDLGATPWHCLVRCANDDDEKPRYAEVFLISENLRQADELALDAAEELAPVGADGWDEAVVVVSDRLKEENLAEALKARGQGLPRDLVEPAVLHRAWLE
jgi:hypothetical protein